MLSAYLHDNPLFIEIKIKQGPNIRTIFCPRHLHDTLCSVNIMFRCNQSLVMTSWMWTGRDTRRSTSAGVWKRYFTGGYTLEIVILNTRLIVFHKEQTQKLYWGFSLSYSLSHTTTDHKSKSRDSPDVRGAVVGTLGPGDWRNETLNKTQMNAHKNIIIIAIWMYTNDM